MRISGMKFLRATAVALGVVSAGNVMSQCTTYDFSSSAGWTQVNTGVSIGAGTINFAGAADGSVPRFVYATVPTLSNTAWSCDFEFRPTAGNAAAHTMVAFSENGGACLSASGQWAGATMMYSNMDCIQAYVQGTVGGTNPGSWKLYGMSKARNTAFAYGYTLTSPPAWNSSAGITLPGAFGTTYYARLQRLSATQGMISLYSDAARTTVIGQSCFAINAAVDNLAYVQSGNYPEGSSVRTFTGTVDNIVVGSMNPVLTGTTSVCVPATVSYLYKLNNGNSCITAGSGFPGSTSYTWSAPAGSIIGAVGGSPFTSASGNGNQTGITPGGSGTISCTVTYPCTTVTYTLAITAVASPTSVITNSIEYCYGQAINVSGSSSANETQYQWGVAPCTSGGVVTGAWIFGLNTFGTAGVYNINSLLGLTGPCPGTIYYKVSLTTSNPSCGSVTSYKVIKIVCPPVVTVSPNPVFLCPGANATLTASGASTYSWTPSAGLSCTNCAAPVAAPTTTTTYLVTGTSTSGCASSATSVTVTVSNLSVVARPDFSMCVDKNLYATVSGGTSPYTYNWSPSAGLLCSHSGAHTPAACPSPIIASNGPVSTNYIVTITDAAGCTVSDMVFVTTDGCSNRMANPNAAASNASSGLTKIYPNPTSNQVNICTGDVIAESIIITDALGRELLHMHPSQTTVEINLEQFATGVYSVQIMTGTEKEVIQLVIEK